MGRSAMDEEQLRERANLISRLFALITIKLEDAAGIAATVRDAGPLMDYARMPKS